QGIGTQELDIVGVVLDPLHYAVFIGIPPTRNPRERQCALCRGPHLSQPFRIAGQGPVEVKMHDLSHLSVRGSDIVMFFAAWQNLAKVHPAFLVSAVAECSLAQRPGQRGEQMRSGSLVVPHVGAVTEAAACLVVTAFEPVESSVRSAETSGRSKRGQI